MNLRDASNNIPQIRLNFLMNRELFRSKYYVILKLLYDFIFNVKMHG